MHTLTVHAAVAAACVVSFAAPAWAQGESAVHGRVVAAADESALPHATVTLRSISTGETVRAIVTDAAGRFVLAGVRADQYMVSGSYDGFRTRDVRLILEPREVRTVTLALDIAGPDVSVTVSAAELPSPAMHSPSSTILTGARVETMPPSERTNLADAIVTSAPGMIRGHDDFVHVRGHEIALNPSINGVSFWENPHAVFSAGFSPEVIDVANVMTGGFPAEYGNRFGGVIDVITKSGLSMRNEGSVALSTGEAGRRTVSGEFGGRRGRLGYYLFGSMFESDRFSSPPDPRAIHDSGRGGHVFMQIDATAGTAGAFRALVMGDGADFEIARTPADIALRPLAAANQRTRQQTAMAGWTRAVSDVAASVSFYQRSSRSRLSPATGPLTATAALDRTLLTIGGKADVTRFAGRHSIEAGVDAVRLQPEERLSYDYAGFSSLTHLLALPHLHFTGGAVEFSGRETGGQLSAYAQDRIQIGRRVTADVGIRIDHHDLVVSQTHASPRVNVAVQVGGDAVIHASYNHFFVPPAVEGVLSSSAGLTRRIREIGRPLPPLAATIEDQFEAGGSARLGPFHVAVTGYYRASDNPVHTTVWPDSRIYSYASFDRERAYGLESRAEAPGLARFGVTGYLNYALGRVDFRNPVTGGFVTEAEHLTDTNRFLAPMDQTHTLTAGAIYRHPGSRYWMGASTEYGSGTPLGHGGGSHEHAAGDADHAHGQSAGSAGRVPGHLTANLAFGIDLLRDGRQRPRVSAQLDIENVANNSDLIAREGEFSPAQYSIPRLISITARVRF